jgi:HK97 gp10 family phage protein
MYPKEQAGVVHTTTEYGIYQEFGTVKMKAQPFMIPAMNIERAGINVSMKDYLRKELAKKSK